MNNVQLLEMRVTNSATATATIRFRQKSNLSNFYIEMCADKTIAGTQNTTFNWSLVRPTINMIPTFSTVGATCKITYDTATNIINANTGARINSARVNLDAFRASAAQDIIDATFILKTSLPLNITSVIDKQILRYDANTSFWKNYDFPSITIQTLGDCLVVSP